MLMLLIRLKEPTEQSGAVFAKRL